jgi:hypothetical protein
MRMLGLCSLLALVACDSGPTKEESMQVFAAATTAMSSAQARAVAEASRQTLQAPAELVLDFTGPCTLGGTVAV